MLLKKQILFKFLLLTIVVGNSTHSFGQSKPRLNKISGYVTYNEFPLELVKVEIKDSKVKTTTNRKGYYRIEAPEKAVIQFSFKGMKPVEVIVEDITKYLNIGMVDEVNDLETVVIKTNNKKNKFRDEDEEDDQNIETAYGTINKKSVSYGKMKTIKSNSLNIQGSDLIETLSGLINYQGVEYDSRRIKRVRLVPNLSISNPEESLAIWDIDGSIYDDPPNLRVGEIDKVTVIRSVSGTTKYGMRGSGGVIVVRTKGAKLKKKKGGKNKANKNIYATGSVPYSTIKLTPSYFSVLDTVTNDKEAYKSYSALAEKNKNSPSFFMDMARYFKTEKQLDTLSLKVLSEAEVLFKDDPEALKAIAYIYQERGLHQKAIGLYTMLIELRPSYSQSFRDLANAYAANKEYKKAWNTYLQYLQAGNYVLEDGIEKMVHSEMSFLYLKKKNASGIRENAEIKNLNLENAESDIRVVFEWNTTEAEFAIEFVDPESRSFAFEHSQEKNNDRIVDEKLRGYSSNEFYLYDLAKGNWFINITYQGNKKYEPTYLKATVYRNWGRINQNQEIKVFKLQRKEYKMGLLKFNSKLSTAGY